MKIINYQKHITIFVKKLELLLKTKLIVGLATIKIFLKTKLWSYGDETTDFNDREMPMADCNHACLALITIECALKNDEHYYQHISDSEEE